MRRQSNSRVPRFFPIKDAAEIIMVSEKTTRKLIREKQLAVHHFGRKLLVSEDDLFAYIASRRRC